MLDVLLASLLSPVVLAFALGALAVAVKSDLEIPAPLYRALSIYLLLAIGLKGGTALSETPLGEVVWPVIGTVSLGILTPLTAYGVLRRMGRMDRTNAAALAARARPGCATGGTSRTPVRLRSPPRSTHPPARHRTFSGPDDVHAS